MMSEEIQAHYYMNVPAFVWDDKELLKKPKAILLYGHIATLANKKGYCWATNEYFVKALNTSKPSVIRYINLLVEKGYIKRKLIYKQNTKEVEQRILSIDTRSGITDDTRSGITDDTDNNTSNNNTSINNSSSSARDSLDTNTKYIDSKSNNAFELYQIHVGMLSGTQTPIFIDYVQKLGDEVVQYAINLMLDQTSRPNFKYLQKILMKYESLNVHSVDEAKKIESQRQNRRSNKPVVNNERAERKKRISEELGW